MGPAPHRHTVDEIIGLLDRALPVQEVGAGTGLATRQLLDAGFEVHASEPNAAMRARFEAALPGFPIQSRALEDQLDTLSKANVLAMNVLHLVEDPQRAVEVLRRRAGGGGRVIIVVPIIGSTVGGIVRAMRSRGATRRQCARFLALQSASAPLQAASRLRAVDLDLSGHPTALRSTDVNRIFRVTILAGCSDPARRERESQRSPGSLMTHRPGLTSRPQARPLQ